MIKEVTRFICIIIGVSLKFHFNYFEQFAPALLYSSLNKFCTNHITHHPLLMFIPLSTLHSSFFKQMPHLSVDIRVWIIPFSINVYKWSYARHHALNFVNMKPPNRQRDRRANMHVSADMMSSRCFAEANLQKKAGKRTSVHTFRLTSKQATPTAMFVFLGNTLRSERALVTYANNATSIIEPAMAILHEQQNSW